MNEDQTKTKTEAKRIGWAIRSSDRPFRGEVFDIRQDQLEISGEEQSYAYVVRPNAVIIVPVTTDGQVVVLEQYRYPVDQWCLEVPAGGTHDTGDESLRQVAEKELREEVGATAKDFTHLGTFYTSPSLTDEKCHVFLAENVSLAQTPEREPSEKIHVKMVPADEAVTLARSGRMQNAPCAIALLMCEPALRAKGYLRNEAPA